MPYRQLVLDPHTPARALNLIHRIEDHYFQDVRAMFRLPAPELGITAGCNFAIAQTLLAVVSGVSVTLFEHGGSKGKGRRFKDLLVAYYPWEDEPTAERQDREHASQIYSLVRNPLAHDLGLDLDTKDRTQRVMVKRLTRANGTKGRSEAGVSGLETEVRPAGLSPVLSLDGDSVVLFLDAFYWGVRRMLVKLAADTGRVSAAETFLSSREHPGA